MKPNIKWTSIAKTAIGVGTILIGAIALFSRSNSSEQEIKLDESELEKEPNEPEEDNETSSSDPTFKRYYFPRVCSICGGPYPLCEDGCSLFDD